MRKSVLFVALMLVGCASDGQRPAYLKQEKQQSPYVSGLPEKQSHNPLMEDFERTYGRTEHHYPQPNPAPYQKPYQPWPENKS